VQLPARTRWKMFCAYLGLKAKALITAYIQESKLLQVASWSLSVVFA